MGVAAAPGKGGAVFKLEALFGFDGGQKAGFFDKFHTVRQQALADYKAREMLFFQHGYARALLHQQRGGHRAGRAGTDDGDVGLLDLAHCVSPLVRLGKGQAA